MPLNLPKRRAKVAKTTGRSVVDQMIQESLLRPKRELTEDLKGDIIDRVSVGEYEYRIAESLDLNPVSITHAKRNDPDFEAEIHEARKRAIWTKLEILLEHFELAMNERDKDYAYTADKLAGHLRWLAERLIPALAPTQNVNVQATVIQWGSNDTQQPGDSAVVIEGEAKPSPAWSRDDEE